MTERQIQLAILRTIAPTLVVACPNYTPINWWECDLWAVSKHGYATEYEIKLSEEDFRNDSRKASIRRTPDGYARVAKHDAIGDNVDCPSRFVYVVPPPLAYLQAMIPDWAGFAICDGRAIQFVKAPTLLHKHKVRAREIRLAERRMWHRYWKALQDIERMRDDHKHLLAQARTGGVA